MGRSKSSKSVLITSDMHVGSSTAVCTPNPEIMDLGTTHNPNKLQQELHKVWQECIDDLHQKPTILVVNGEPCDGGNPKGLGKQSWSTNLQDQLNDAEKLLDEIPYQNLLFTRGSGYHVDQQGTNFEEIIAKQMNADRYKAFGGSGMTDYYALVELHGKTFNFTHHVGFNKWAAYRSVDYDSFSPIMNKDGYIRIEQVGDYIDRTIDCDMDYSNDSVLSFTSDGDVVFSKINKTIRHENTDIMYRLSTRFGKIIDITGGHGVFSMKRKRVHGKELQQIIDTPVRNLTEEDRVLIPTTMPESDTEIKSFDILKELWNVDFDMSVLMDDNLKKIVDKKRKMFGKKSIIYSALKQERITISLLKEMCIDISEISENIELSSIGSTQTTPRILPFDKDLSKIIGYYLAEGHISNNVITFSFGKVGDKFEEIITDELVKCCKNIGIEAKKSTYKIHREGNYIQIRIYNSIFSQFFKYTLEFNKTTAKTKRIPFQLFNTTKLNRDAFINSYINGDGWINNANNTENVTTASKILATDLMYLYLQNNIVVSILKIKATASGFNPNGIYYQVYHTTKKKHDSFKRYNSKLAFVKVKDMKVTKPTSVFVYDFSIGDKNHSDNFVANGLACHNTTALAREMAGMVFEKDKMGHADIIVRSHVHYFVHIEFVHSHGFTTPAWKFPDGHLFRGGTAGTTPDIGMVEVIIEPNGQVEIVKHIAEVKIKPLVRHY